jgi:DNA (cytosine-5)-methyltransferase 1
VNPAHLEPVTNQENTKRGAIRRRLNNQRDTAPSLAARTTAGGGFGTDAECDGAVIPIQIAHSLKAEGFDASEDGTGRGVPLVADTLNCPKGGSRTNQVDSLDYIPELAWALQERDSKGSDSKGSDSSTKEGHLIPIPFDTTQVTSQGNYSNPQPGDPCHPLASGAHAPAVAFEPGSIARNAGQRGLQDQVSTLRSNMGDNQPGLLTKMKVRRLTVRECEKLQAFPVDFTRYALSEKTGKVYEQADGPRYKQLGNAVTVSVLAWIALRVKRFSP